MAAAGSTGFVVLIVILILIILFLAYQLSQLSPPRKSGARPTLVSYLQYEPLALPMEPKGDLYWSSIRLEDPYAGANRGQNYEMLVDTGSDLITVPANSCLDCEGPRWQPSGTGPIRSSQYQGGQAINYEFAQAYSPTLRQNIQVAVMVGGSQNPMGPTRNIFGLLNPSLQLHYLRMNFRARTLTFLADWPGTPASGWASLRRLPHWSVPVTGLPGVDWIVLDSGTNYAVVDPTSGVKGGFSFTVGQRQISVPASLIRYRSSLIPRSIVVGSFIMQDYDWLFDLVHSRVGLL